MSLDINTLLTLFIIYVRVLSFLIMVPIFGKETLPPTFKLFLATAISFSLFLYYEIEPSHFPTTAHLMLAFLKEFIFGFTAGLLLRLIFDAMHIAGEFISVNMGLGLATVFNPQQPQTTIISSFFSLLATLLFLAIGGAEIILLSLGKSLEKIPPGSFNLYDINPQLLLDFFYESFLLAFKVSLPIIAVMLLLNIVLALINRFIPQINVFMVGLPIQIFLGLLILTLATPFILWSFSTHLKEYIIRSIALLGG